MALVSDNFNSALFMEEIQKYECMNAYTINFARITKISWYGWIARKKKGEKFQVTPDEAENKYNYSRNSSAAIFHSILRENNLI